MIPLFAVHISDGVLTLPWLLLGFAVAAAMIWVGSRRIEDEEIPRIGILAAVFFVASQIHVKVIPTSVHLLLNGLVGIVLGTRSVLAIAVGLLLQAVLLGHGGYTTLGLNCCVIGLPALLARPAFKLLLRDMSAGASPFRYGVIAAAYLLHPLLALVLAMLLLVGDWLGWGNDADFRAGFLVGAGCVAATTVLDAVLLVVGGTEDWRAVAVLVLAAHVPIAFVEGMVVGFVASFLGRVKPELLGGRLRAA
jgi:cobalt/nickel transport system permease protein